MSDDLDMLAAEYVLGTLDAAERAGFERRLAGSEPARRAVEEWSRRLGPLALAAGDVEPPESRKELHHKAELTAELRRQSRRTTIVSTSFGGPREGGGALL